MIEKFFTKWISRKEHKFTFTFIKKNNNNNNSEEIKDLLTRTLIYHGFTKEISKMKFYPSETKKYIQIKFEIDIHSTTDVSYVILLFNEIFEIFLKQQYKLEKMRFPKNFNKEEFKNYLIDNKGYSSLKKDDVKNIATIILNQLN